MDYRSPLLQREIFVPHNFNFMDLEKLKEIAQKMIAPGKGILAIDESTGTCQKRFEELGVECNESTRQSYRQLLVTAPVSEWISGMILFDETLRQKTEEGVPFPQVLKAQGILTGIKVDGGTKALALHSGEVVTEGLDGLRERLAEYKALGAEFAKWRAVIALGEGLPSSACIKANTHALARYAALCQEVGLVPMVEPEILLEGDHEIELCAEVSQKVWMALFEELKEQGVALEGTILKTSMVLAGAACDTQGTLDTVATMTVNTLKAAVPKEVAGVVFLSGGQSDQEATERLNRMHQLHGNALPWPLSFSYGRSIQRPALHLWAKDKTKVKEAQEALAHRAKMNGLAAKGEWSEGME